jgi:hypothetical protein
VFVLHKFYISGSENERILIVTMISKANEYFGITIKQMIAIEAVVASMWYLLLVLSLALFLEEGFLTAFLSPVRWCARLAGSLIRVGPAFGTYMVRRWSWPVLLRAAMGLEGYPFEPPAIRQYPNNVPETLVKYENMPTGAEGRALDKRNAWISCFLGDVSQTFSKIAVTGADITSLLHTVEAELSLVHAAYYTDDECIDQIAEWIAGRDKIVRE